MTDRLLTILRRLYTPLCPESGTCLITAFMKIVSACLAGVPCRYDCQAKERAHIKAWVDNGEAIAVCPEEMGGLPTPRPPAEKIGDKVISVHGVDVTAEYKLGAEKALAIAKQNGVTEAYLKSKSPMCGYKNIYDGTYSGKVIPGNGARP